MSPPISSLPMDVTERFQAIRLASPYSLAPDMSDKAADSKALTQDIGFVERSPPDSPPSPWSAASSLADSSLDESPQMSESRAQHITNEPESLPPAFREAQHEAHLWCAALKAKKAAMETLLHIQKSLERIEESVARYISMDYIQGTHAQFLSTLDPSIPEASYLIAVGRAVVNPSPLSQPTIQRCDASPSNLTYGGSRIVRCSGVGTRVPAEPVATRG